ISRPPNCFIIFRNELHQINEKKKLEDRRTFEEVSKDAGLLWRAATDIMKNHYRDLAQQKKLEFLTKHPDYEYKPRPKGEGKQAMKS
ncbi:hypothetical protein BDQ17DRAFT_1201961, partial [Cyathus striatus]